MLNQLWFLSISTKVQLILIATSDIVISGTGQILKNFRVFDSKIKYDDSIMPDG